MDRPPRGPSFICARPEGNFTPLVPLDEFPPNISIRGVSRTLTPAQTQGMTSCGMARARTEPWAFEGASTMAAPTKNDLTELKSALIKMIGDNSLPIHYRDLIQNIMGRCLINVPSAQATTSATQAGPAPASTNQGAHLSGDDHVSTFSFIKASVELTFMTKSVYPSLVSRIASQTVRSIVRTGFVTVNVITFNRVCINPSSMDIHGHTET